MLFLIFQGAKAQYSVLGIHEDTLNYNYRTLTNRLDSIPFLQSGYTTLQPGGSSIAPSGALQSNNKNFYQLFQNHAPLFSSLKNTYSGIPHLGFYYSFGSRGLQNVHVDYQQTLAKKFNINLNYTGNHLNKEAGFLRHSGYTNNVVQLLMNYKNKSYQGLYYFDYYFGQRRSNGGVIDPSQLNQLALPLIPVRNETSLSKLNNFQVGTQHLFFVTKDSVVKQGFVYQNKMTISSRKYTESGATLSNYAMINKDSSGTYDYAQTSTLLNEFGYFIKSPHFSVDAMGFHRFWLYKNYGSKTELNEIGVSGNVQLNWQKIEFNSHLEFAFVGLPGEMTSNSSLKWNIIKDLQLLAYLNVHNYYPSMFMTKYLGNSILWDNTNNSRLQQTITAGGEIFLSKKFPIKVGVNFNNLSNNYWLIDGHLRNDTLKNATNVSTYVKSDLKAGSFHFDPYLGINVNSKEFNYVPLLDARLSLYWNKKLFSTKKFDFILGVSAYYRSKYDLIGYNNLVDLYEIRPQNAGMSYSPIIRLDIFTGFQIDNFRFFVRYENLDSFWNGGYNFDYLDYPISRGVIHIGLTWDFFN